MLLRTARLLAALLLLGPLLRWAPPAALCAEGRPGWTPDVEALTAGVSDVAAPGVPGTLAVWGEQAFPVLLGRTGTVERAPVVAAARAGPGRVVAFAHDGYLDDGAAAVADTARLLVNAVRWAAGRPKGPLRVGVASARLTQGLAAEGLDVQRLAAGWAQRLKDVDVLVASGDLSDAEREQVALFLAGGGGLLVAQTGWGWLQVTRAASVRANPWNRLLQGAGLAFTDATAERTSSQGFAFQGVPGREFHAQGALDVLREAAEAPKRVPLPRARQASANARAAWPFLPREGPGLRTQVLRLVEQHAQDLVPTPEKPLRADRPLERFLLAVQVGEEDQAPPEEVRAHPAAAAFPGAVPPTARAAARQVEVPLSVPGWHSTGLYAAPGAVVSVRAAATTGPGEAPGGPGGDRLAVQVGCHTDALWHLDSWPRVPVITARRALTGGRAVLASPFGGPVYVVVERPAPGLAVLTVDGAVEAPLYVRGRTTKAQWQRARRAPGPWGELVAHSVALSVPSALLRELDDPEPLLALWDQVLDHAADLAARPRERERRERYVADVEISAGYMHSGYPIMTHLDAAARMLDAPLLTARGDWGLFHELGHNHQQPDWTFDGTVEVTCNLWSLYLTEKLTGRPGTQGHDALRTRAERTRAHLAKGAPFQAWKDDPFLALEMYVQLQEAFGWEAFQAVFAAYRALPEDQRPRDEEARRDQWMLRLSRQVGRNLAPFFAAWGVPVSAAARAEVSARPVWMPPGFPPR